MFRLLVLLTVASIAAATFDEEINYYYETMPEDTFIDYFNNKNFTWKITNNKHLEGEQLTGVILGDEFADLPEIDHYRAEETASMETFDSRTKWPRCKSIKEIYNQGSCGSCWTFGSASVISDRTCIHAKQHVRLSEQDFKCLKDCVCCGGDPLKAFKYWVDKGLVTLDCLPYNIAALKNEHRCKRNCVNRHINYRKDKHYGDKVYRIKNTESQIKAEIIKNGPIQATFTLFKDFYKYSHGVYVHKFGKKVGRHSVRIIGFGKENGDNYWLVANSWGSNWGELRGFFKVKTFQRALEFENYLIAGLPYY